MIARVIPNADGGDHDRTRHRSTFEALGAERVELRRFAARVLDAL